MATTGLVNTRTGLAKRRGRLLVISASTLSGGAATVAVAPTGLTQRVDYLYNSNQRLYFWDGVVAKGDQISRAIQWTAAAGNQITATCSLLL